MPVLVRVGLAALLAANPAAPGLAAACPARAAAATPSPAPSPTPCPGTTPENAPTASSQHGTTHPGTPLPTPASVPPPAIPHRDVVVGGSRLATAGVVTDLLAGVPAPSFNATSWVVADATTGSILAAKAPHALMRPASTLKTLTALALLPELDPATSLLADPTDAAADGTKVGIVPGSHYTVGQLFQAMLMMSANDAVYLLTRSYPGGRAAAVAADNALAKHLGALDTIVKDPSGLDGEGQVSSAYDLAVFGRAALQDKTFRAYSTTRTAQFPGAEVRPTPGRPAKPRTSFGMQNHNKLLYNYPGTVGVKNGFTSLAHGTYIAAASRGGKTYLFTFMCADFVSWRSMASMLDWAFANGAKARPVGELVAPGSLEATPQATPADTDTMTAATPSTSESPMLAAAPPTRSTTTWAAVGALALAVVGLGVVVSRRLSRTARPHGRHSTGR